MIAYILKSSLSLLILFGLYWFLLRKEKLFVFNRFFLVSSVVFSLLSAIYFYSGEFPDHSQTRKYYSCLQLYHPGNQYRRQYCPQ